MRALRKTLSFVLLLLTVPLLFAQIAIHSVRSLVLDPAFPKQVMREAGVYTAVERSITDSLLQHVRSKQPDLPLSRERLSRIVSRVLLSLQLEQISERLIDELYAWAWGNDPQPVLLVDLTAVRRTLPVIVRAELEAEVEALPVCTLGQLPDLWLRPPTAMPPCKAADPKVNAAFIDQALRNMNLDQVVPREIELAQEMGGRENPSFWADTWEDLQLVRWALNLTLWGWLVLTLLLLLLALLNLDRWHTPFGWIGAAGILAGGPLVLAGLGATNLLTPVVVNSLGGGAGQGAAAGAVGQAVRAVSETVRNLSFTVLLLGLAAIAVMVYGKMNDQPPEDAAL